MSTKKDPAANSLIPAENRSLEQYSSKIVNRGLELAQKLLTKPIRLLVVDDIPETRENIRKLLFFEDDIDIVGNGENGVEAIDLFESLRPDILIMCICMPVMDGITATAEICRRHPDAKVIIASVMDPADYARRAWSAGAKAYLLKPFSGEELSSAIREVANGGVHPSILVFDPKSLKEYYARSNVAIEGLMRILERLNQSIADEVGKTDLTPLKHDLGTTATEMSPDEIAQVLRVRLGPFLRTDLEDQMANIWHIEIEQYLDELKKYFGDQTWFDHFGWDKVKGKILQYPAAQSS